jgi:Cytosine/uracil/thiamine/allantoin permeases
MSQPSIGLLWPSNNLASLAGYPRGLGWPRHFIRVYSKGIWTAKFPCKNTGVVSVCFFALQTVWNSHLWSDSIFLRFFPRFFFRGSRRLSHKLHVQGTSRDRQIGCSARHFSSPLPNGPQPLSSQGVLTRVMDVELARVASLPAHVPARTCVREGHSSRR